MIMNGTTKAGNISIGNTSTGTETFDESNLAVDFAEVMQHAESIQEILTAGHEAIEANIANAKEDDAYSGEAAAEIRSQWNDLASTFHDFVKNFNDWYDQGVEAQKENQMLQERTAKVSKKDNISS